MKTKQFHQASGSRFGHNIGQNLPAKRAVAKKVVDTILWDNEVDTLFINDGTSTSYVWCYYLERWVQLREQHPLRVWTNNYDVMMQALCEPVAASIVNIKLAEGDFDYRFCAAIGGETTQWVAKVCRGKTCLLAVTALDAELGPSGITHGAKEIKRVIIDGAENLIVVADSSKLSNPRQAFHAANAKIWSEWLQERPDRLWVVTDLDPSITLPYRAYNNPSTPLEWQSENARLLQLSLGANFIVARPATASQPTSMPKSSASAGP